MNSPLRLIVTGMHRSGTSFVASLFAAWGVRMGDRLLAPDRGNPTGYFEDVEFQELNRRMLTACVPEEAGHRDWGWTESGAFDPSPLAAFRDEAAARIAARDREGAAWGWKDPRTSLLLDFYDDLLDRDARVLLLYRHPWEVADSMLRTGADVWLAHPEYAPRIWAAYNRRLLDFHARHRDRTLLVSTNRVLRDPEQFAALVRERFGIDADTATFAQLRAEDLFVSTPDADPLPRLWHFTHPDAIALLGALDDAADLGNDRAWEASARAPRPQLGAQPRVSVVIPCHNDGEYLVDAVASVEREAAGAELVIVDDGSTQPRTREVLAALTAAGHRVIHQPQSGLSAARNRGIAESTGDFVLPLDADNRLLPGFVTDAIALLDANPDAGVVYGDRREFGLRTGDVVVPEFDLARMLWSNEIDACAVMRREVWRDAGGFDVTFTDWEDWDFWLSAASRGWRFLRIPRPTFAYRVRPGSVHQRFLNGDGYLPTLERIYAKHRDLLPEHAAAILVAAHAERRALFGHVDALRDARDTLQIEIDRLAEGTRHELAARDRELASLRAVLSGEPAIAQPEPRLTGAARVFTIIARNYLAHARVLAASLARHNPGVRLDVIVLDDPDRTLAAEPSFTIIHAADLPFDPPSDFHTMAAIYDVTELATAIKPWAFAHLFARGAAAAIYLDPDIEIFASLGPLEPQTLAHGMLLTPHVTAPLPRDGKRPDDRDLLLAGIYNLGFLALSAETAKTFLPWWGARLRRDCLNEPERGLFVDQRWIDFAPALFEPAIVKDPGYNVAYWNLPHRELARDGERITVDGQPLRFFHFSGFSPRSPHVLSKHQHESIRVRLSERPLVAELCARYAAALDAAGYDESARVPYRYAATANGIALDARTRRVLRRTYIDDEARGVTSFANPFTREGADDVIARLTRPASDAPAVPAYLAEIWRERVDLRLAFPRIESADAARFLDWVHTQGVREHDIPDALVPRESSAQTVAHTKPLARGVNVYGYAFAESGTGQIVRSVVAALAALAAEGIPYAVVPFTRTLARQERAFDELGAASPMFDTNLICVNADQVPHFFDAMRDRLLPGTRNIGLWAWEVDDLPASMAASERYLDEVWGISRFTADALARSLTKPVRAFPLPVAVPRVRPQTRQELGMPEGFLFLFCFDYDSVFRRKNPLATVAAFREAFGDRSDVVLFIKTTNAERHGGDDEALRAAAAGGANIVIRDAYVTSDEYFSMLAACDCYVSLHRSEGFGLTVAEAMALGKPVISTGHSATLEFTNVVNSYLVPARVVAVGDDAPPYPPGSHWAEPDVAVAARVMRRVFKDREDAAAVGARAQADIHERHSPAARGPLLRQLLDQHRERHETVAHPAAPASVAVDAPVVFETGAFESDAYAAESLLASPRPDLPSPFAWLTTPLRRLVLRCMRVYWVQQLAVDRAIVAAMRTLRRESRSEAAANAALVQQQRAAQERIDGETARLREELDALTAEVHALRENMSGLAQPRAKARTEAEREHRDDRPSAAPRRSSEN